MQRQPNAAGLSPRAHDGIRGRTRIPGRGALQSSLEGTRGGVWIQDTYAPSSRVSVEPGLRVDWSTVNPGRDRLAADGGFQMSPALLSGTGTTGHLRVS